MGMFGLLGIYHGKELAFSRRRLVPIMRGRSAMMIGFDLIMVVIIVYSALFKVLVVQQLEI